MNSIRESSGFALRIRRDHEFYVAVVFVSDDTTEIQSSQETMSHY